MIDHFDINEATDRVRQLLTDRRGHPPTDVEVDHYLDRIRSQRISRAEFDISRCLGRLAQDPTHLVFAPDWDHRRLLDASSAVAHHLRTMKVKPGDVVGCCAQDDHGMAVSVLAALQVGACLLPLDPEDSPLYSSSMLSRYKGQVVISDSRNLDASEIQVLNIQSIETTASGSSQPTAASNPDARVILLPGGSPFFELSNQALACRIEAFDQALPPGMQIRCDLGLAAADRMIGVLWSLEKGRCVSGRPEGPTALLTSSDRLPDLFGTDRLQSVTDLVVIGELISQKLRGALLRAYPNLGITYLFAPPISGPTAMLRVKAGAEGPSERFISIGRIPFGIGGILDAEGQPTMPHVVGDLVLTGPGIANTGRLDTTRERRVGRAFSDESGETIVVADSQDSWIWRRGQRFDLTKIETVLNSHEAILSSTIVSRATPEGLHSTVAYVVTGRPLVWATLKSWVRDHLSAAAVPSDFVAVTRIPLTKSGAVDVDSLARLPVLPTSEDVIQKSLLIDAAHVVRRRHLDQRIIHISPRGGATADTRSESRAIESMSPPSEKPLAYANGGELLVASESFPKTLVDALLRSAELHGENGLTLVEDSGESLLTYRELLVSAKHCLAGLQAAGLAHGDHVILQISSLRHYYACFWGCLLGGVIPVTVAVPPSYRQPNGATAKLIHAWELLQRPRIITSEGLLDAVSTLPRLSHDDRPIKALAIEHLLSYAEQPHLSKIDPADIAFIQLSSGSTNASKCIQITHDGVISHTVAAVAANGYCAEDINLNWLPLDHVVPLLTCHIKDTILGCHQVAVATAHISGAPLRWLDLIEKHQVTHSWSPNFGFKLVSDALSRAMGRTWNLSSIRRFMNAGEQVTPTVARGFLRAVAKFGVNDSVLQPAFGMAEACTCMTFNNKFSSASGTIFVNKTTLSGQLDIREFHSSEVIEFVSLGPPVAGVEIRIANRENATVTEDVIGQLQIRGRVITPGYLRNDTANANAFVGDRWFDSGDLGFIHDGELVLTGRAKETIIVRGANFYCHEIEDVVNTVAGVRATYSAACAVEDNAAGTEGFAIFFVPEAADQPSIVRICAEISSKIIGSLGSSPSFVIPVESESFPKTSSGKIQRLRLKEAFASGKFEETIKRIDIAQSNERTIPAWFHRSDWRPSQGHAYTVQLPRAILIGDKDELLVDQLATDLRNIGTEVWIAQQTANGIDSAWQHESLDIPMNGPSEVPVMIIDLSFSEAGERAPVCTSEVWNHLSQIDGLLLRLKALANSPYGNPSRFFLVTRGAHSVNGGEGNYALAVASGIARSIPHEVPELQTTHIDLDPAAPPESGALNILEELFQRRFEPEVCYRSGTRLVRRLVPYDLSLSPSDSSPLRPNGRYLIVGGLGQIGLELCRHLRENFDAQVAVLSRRTMADATLALASLDSLGGETLYIQGDVTDETAVAAAFRKIDSAWGGQLDAVFFLAAAIEERGIQDERWANVERTMRIAVDGGWNVAQAMSGRRETALVFFSSVNGLFGGRHALAYSASCRYLDCFAEWLQVHHHARTYGLSWSLWRETSAGNGAGKLRLVQGRGYRPLLYREGFASLAIALKAGLKRCIIGLDELHPEISAALESPVEPVEELVLVTTTAVAAAPSFDRFGTVIAPKVVLIPQFPRKPDGSIDQDKLADLAEGTERPSVARGPITLEETRLLELWGVLLRRDDLSVLTNFFDAGGNSLSAARLIARINEEFHVGLSLAELFQRPTVAELALTLAASRLQPPLPAISRAPRNNEIPLSYAQEQLWALEQMQPSGRHYVIAEALRVRGHVDEDAMREAFNGLSKRHEVLRTQFHFTDGGIHQAILEDSVLDFCLYDASGHSETELRAALDAELDRGFLLDREPPFRVRLFRCTDTERIVLITIHHIVADAWSMGILLRDFAVLYAIARRGQHLALLAPQELQFADYAVWQRTWMQDPKGHPRYESQRQALSGYSGALNLPYDRSRRAAQSFEGAQIHIEISSDLTRRLTHLAIENAATLYMVLLGTFTLLLSRLAGTNDVVVGCPVAGRSRSSTENLVGLLVNLLPVRTRLETTKSFAEFIGVVRDGMLDAYAAQDIPFNVLANGFGARVNGAPPLVQAVLVMHNIEDRGNDYRHFEDEGLAIEPIAIELGIAKFELTLSFVEKQGALSGALEFNTDLFDHTTAEHILRSFSTLLNEIVGHPHVALSKLSFCDEERTIFTTPSWGPRNDQPLVDNASILHSIRNAHPSVTDTSPLGPSQSDLFVNYLRDPTDLTYVLAYSITLDSGLDASRWERALRAAERAAPTLKSRFFTINQSFFQATDTAVSPPFELVHMEDAALDPVEGIVSKALSEPFDLFKGAARHHLVLGPNDATAILTCHHIAADAISAALFFQRALAAYAGETIEDDRRFLAWAATSALAAHSAIGIEQWAASLRTAQALVPPSPRADVYEEEARLDATALIGLATWCESETVGLSSVLKCLTALVLARSMAMEQDFVLLDILSGRDPQDRETIGCLYRVLPTFFSGEQFHSGSVAAIVSAYQFRRQKERALPVVSSLALADVLAKIGAPIFINFYDSPDFTKCFAVPPQQPCRLRIHERIGADETHILFEQDASGLRVALRTRNDGFVGRLLARAIVEVAAQVARGITRIEALEFVDKVATTAAVRVAEIVTFERMAPTLHRWFEERSKSKPDSIAVTSPTGSLTYRDLNRRANLLARRLCSEGVRPGSLVGLCCERTHDLIIGMLAILKAGCGYLPLDPALPLDRRSFMCQDAGVELVLGQSDLQPDAVGGARIVSLHTNWASAPGEVTPDVSLKEPDNLEIHVPPQATAYVIYTSGSTGQPKGVVISHENVARLFAATERWFDFSSEDVWTAFHSYGFDFSVWEIWGALLYGGRLVMVPTHISRSPDEMLKLIERERVTVLNQTPSAFRQLISAPGALTKDLALRIVIFGGEALSFSSLLPWAAAYGDAMPQLVNMYGITESTVHVTFRKLTRRDIVSGKGSLIGGPIPDLGLYVLDPQMRPVPIGKAGELYVGGPGLARGYLNRPGLTAERFVPDPFTTESGCRMYRSGDLVRVLPNSEIEYLNRLDRQVKIRGYRIELGEIETEIRSCDGVRDVAVIADADSAGDAVLLAYVVSDFLDIEAWRAKLRRRLPEYMVPAAFTQILALPLTVNGKLDREQLPRRVMSSMPPISTPTSIQDIVVNVLSGVLDGASVDLDTNFYDLGATSLKLVQMHRLLASRIPGGPDAMPALIELFQYSTVRELVSRLDGRTLEPLSDATTRASQRIHAHQTPASQRSTLRSSLRSLPTRIDDAES